MPYKNDNNVILGDSYHDDFHHGEEDPRRRFQHDDFDTDDESDDEDEDSDGDEGEEDDDNDEDDDEEDEEEEDDHNKFGRENQNGNVVAPYNDRLASTPYNDRNPDAHNWTDEHNKDAVSDVSRDQFDEEGGRGEEGENEEGARQFKYSTAEIGEDSKRSAACCFIAMCILCIIVAVVVSVLLVKKTTRDKSAQSPVAPTSAPLSNNANSTQLVCNSAMFSLSQSAVDASCNTQDLIQNGTSCQKTCQGFDNCNPFLPPNATCFFNNTQGCLNYARCQVLSHQIDPPPNNLQDICSPAAIASNPSDCELKCLGVECCYAKNKSCVYQNFYACVDYVACQNLRKDLRVPIPNVETIKSLCNPQQTGSVTQTGACAQACQPADCCWDPNPSNNCLQSDFFTCLLYGDCNKLQLPPAGTAVAASSTNIGVSCAFSNFNQAGAQACATACSPGACCHETGAAYCFPEDPLGCLQYDICKIAPNITGNSTGGNPGGASADAKVPESAFPLNATRLAVDSNCSAEAFSNNTGGCQSVCKGFECCNPYLPKNESCFYDHSQDCIDYARCHVLDSLVTPPPRDLSAACSIEALVNDSSVCEFYCIPVECCFSNDTSCATNDLYACIDYAPCQNLRRDFRVAVPVGIENLCSNQTRMDSQTNSTCEQVCQAASCCWNATDSCFQSDFFACLSYSPCAQLDIPPAGTVVDAPPGNISISSVCNLQNQSNTHVQQCKKACSSGACCFATGIDNCFDMDPLGCLQYTSCKSASTELNATTNVTHVILNETQAYVQSVCSNETLANNSATACLDTCQGFDCCDPLLTGGCFYDNVQGCVNYARCHILDRKVPPPPSNLSDVCSPQAIAKNSTLCEQQCQPVKCCSSNVTSCIVDQLYACLDYAPCENLRKDLRVPVPSGNSIEDACSGGPNIFKNATCTNACAPASCCWDPKNSCIQSDLVTCLLYNACDQQGIPSLAVQ